jgi:hypothetical protein
MKRAILLFVLLFAIPIAFGETDDQYSIELSLDKNSIQIGDPVFVEGKILINSEVIDDQVNAIFYFRSDDDENQVYLSIFDGEFSFSPQLRNLNSGTYLVSVGLFDLNGDELVFFEDVKQLYVDSRLVLDLSLDKDQLIPGEKLQLLGVIQRNLDKKNVPSGVVTILVDGEEYFTEISNGNLDFEIDLSDDIKSDYHNIYVEAEDSHGNSGETNLEYYIIPEEKNLEIELDKKTYNPGESIMIQASVYDQASEKISTELNIKLYNSNGDKVLEEIIMSTSSVSYTFEEYAKPGEWVIKVEASSGLEKESSIEVPKLEMLEIELVGQRLKIENTGNVEYKDNLVINAVNEVHQKTFSLRTKLNPGEEMLVDLYKELKDMQYELEIENTGQVFNIEISDERGVGEKVGDFFTRFTGQAVRLSGSKEGGFATYTFGLIILVLILLVFIFRNPKITVPRIRKKPKGQRFKTKANGSTSMKKTSEKAEIEDFKTRILKDIEKSNVREDTKKSDEAFNVRPFFEQQDKPKRVEFDKPLRKDK